MLIRVVNSEGNKRIKNVPFYMLDIFIKQEEEKGNTVLYGEKLLEGEKRTAMIVEKHKRLKKKNEELFRNFTFTKKGC